ncbi:hypothetical protein F4677DRAFT_461419, partial [Hypoxylon crocopeplum]
MLIAMAWPGSIDDEGLEIVPAPNAKGKRKPEEGIIHGDLNIQNVMIGNIESVEHRLVPQLILIDFGSSRTLPDDRAAEAVKANMYNVAAIMLTLIGGNIISGSANMRLKDETTIRSTARDLDGLNPKYGPKKDDIDRHTRKMRNLDPDLRDLVIQCLATSSDRRPELRDLVRQVERNVNQKTPDDYKKNPCAKDESDDALKRISKEFFFQPEEIKEQLGGTGRYIERKRIGDGDSDDDDI